MLQLPAVYILVSLENGRLNTGVTDDLPKCLSCDDLSSQMDKPQKLVYFALTQEMRSAIAWEAQIRASSRAKKLALIEDMNPAWRDLSSFVIN